MKTFILSFLTFVSMANAQSIDKDDPIRFNIPPVGAATVAKGNNTLRLPQAQGGIVHKDPCTIVPQTMAVALSKADKIDSLPGFLIETRPIDSTEPMYKNFEMTLKDAHSEIVRVKISTFISSDRCYLRSMELF